ncbi:MAG: Beta-galactosidase C-terminal domain, partial [candidate division KSB1 bacterium]|nr:Beta-galactosidase C-terminal domain [candidate division KSB1 bacterium]
GEPGVLVVPRQSSEAAYTIVINLSYKQKTITLKEKLTQNLIANQPLSEASWTLRPYEVIIGVTK